MKKVPINDKREFLRQRKIWAECFRMELEPNYKQNIARVMKGSRTDAVEKINYLSCHHPKNNTRLTKVTAYRLIIDILEKEKPEIWDFKPQATHETAAFQYRIRNESREYADIILKIAVAFIHTENEKISQCTVWSFHPDKHFKQ